MLGLSLLLSTAAQALDRLSLLRMAAGTDVLTPEYRDPALQLSLDGPACAAQRALLAQIQDMGGQLRVVGAATSAAAILDRPEAGRRLTALLALICSGAWQAVGPLPRGGQLHRRVAADGRIYLLAGAPDRGASHAPHAMRGYAERLWILPPEHACADGQALPAEPPALAAEGPDSLSLQAALRDLLLSLLAAGHVALAARFATLGETAATPAELAIAAPLPTQVPAAA